MFLRMLGMSPRSSKKKYRKHQLKNLHGLYGLGKKNDLQLKLFSELTYITLFRNRTMVQFLGTRNKELQLKVFDKPTYIKINI